MIGSLSAIAIYGGLLGLLVLALSINVTRLRAKYKTLFGDADHDDLRRAVRTQANALEYVPICLLMLLIMASTGYAAWLVHVLGIVLLVGRLLHVYGMLVQTDSDQPMGRAIGALLTWVVLGVTSFLALIGGLS
jgi:hypothetical protein